MFQKLSLLITLSLLLLSCAPKEIIELPITEHNGTGPFHIGLGGISPDPVNDNGNWKNCRLQIKGIPETWTDARKGSIQTNIYQMVYQNYIAGNITPDFYQHLQDSWNWDPDTLNLSKTPLKCQIAFATGKDSTGETMIIVDANNNLDFSDDMAFRPTRLDPQIRTIEDSLIMKQVVMVSFEQLQNNKIVTSKAPLSVVDFQNMNMLMSCFPLYATAQFQDKEIAVSTENLNDPSFKESVMVLLDDSLKAGKKADFDKLVYQNEYVNINDKIYEFHGIDRNRNVLKLKKIATPPDELYSTQIGFNAFPFRGRNLLSKDSLSLESLKGKYVYLDFWSVYCGPCIRDLPHLKALHDSIDTNKIEYVGIVCSSPEDDIMKVREKYHINWPLIISHPENNIEKLYGISGYPSTFLIDPEGKIIARDLRSQQLKDKVKQLSLHL
ncbi:TlpA family protein disulfide reductase [Saccharicrinis sp. FJH2]|uniref:TlpA family protein disulfide reductase n=1 Tax=Saccharicrinis sp. FJH65 TaxID=3344659 RepID=UPI0035F4FBBD